MALRESVQYVWNNFHLEKQLNVLINRGLIPKSEDTPRKSKDFITELEPLDSQMTY